MGESKPHIVLVPALAQGHLIPFMELGKLLASHDLSVSYITTPGISKWLRPQVQGLNLDIRLVSLPLPPIDGIPPGIDSPDQNIPSHIATLLYTSSSKLAGPLEQWLDQQMQMNNTDENPCNSAPPVCIISDAFTGWVHSSGAKFGIPTIVYHTCGAFAVSVMHSLLTYMPQNGVEGDDEYFVMPHLSFDLKLRKSDLPVMMREQDSIPLQGFMREEVIRSLDGRGIIFNTFYEFDSIGIDHIRTLTGSPVWSIGPLLPPAVFDGTRIDHGNMSSRGQAADIGEEECLRWLDSQRPQSVVFLCFGTYLFLNDKQIGALAAALEASEQPFIWVIRSPDTEPERKGTDVGLPVGFEERTRERGLIISGWAPQLLILSHSSVGAFMSHCGWNSTLESISLGVPMITWPMFAEQPFNSKLLVDYLGIGIQICLDVSSMPDEEEVRRAVTMLLVEEEGKEMRRRAQELRKLAKIAVDKQGSSYISLKCFVEEMQKLHQSRLPTTVGLQL